MSRSIKASFLESGPVAVGGGGIKASGISHTSAKKMIFVTYQLKNFKITKSKFSTYELPHAQGRSQTPDFGGAGGLGR